VIGNESAECFVCRKHRGEIPEPGGAIYDDDVVRAGHAGLGPDGEPAYLGYLFVEPKRHAAGLGDLTNHEAEALGLLVTRLSRALRQSQNAVHVYAFVLGDNVPHLHVHLVPRYPETPPEYWGLAVTDWPDAPRGGAAEIAALCDRLRASMAGDVQLAAHPLDED
jgi:diadenosine tetraphosphate (Ap4A) HIT family hydrolase